MCEFVGDDVETLAKVEDKGTAVAKDHLLFLFQRAFWNLFPKWTLPISVIPLSLIESLPKTLY